MDSETGAGGVSVPTDRHVVPGNRGFWEQPPTEPRPSDLGGPVGESEVEAIFVEHVEETVDVRLTAPLVEPPVADGPEREVADSPVVELPGAAAFVDDGGHDVGRVAATESEVALTLEPEVALPVQEDVVDLTVDTRPDDVHPAGCACLSCRWATFRPAPATEGPAAVHAFYFDVVQQLLANVTHSEAPGAERTDESDSTDVHSQKRGKRRSSSQRARR